MVTWVLCPLLFFALSLADEDVYSCGGFIKTLGNVKIDYKNIAVRLYTAEGNLKYETDCAPNNGYFMIPVYQKGEYRVRVEPPEGWHFEPEEVALTVDGLTDPCTTAQDINFILAGFSVTGRVRNQGTDTGPSGFKVSLLDTSTRKEVSSTTTLQGGRYTFANVLPGAYSVVLEGGHSCVADGESRIHVKAAPSNSLKDIFIQGYSLSGSVQSQGKGIGGVSLFLLSSTPKATQCNLGGAPQVKLPESLKNEKTLCHVLSASDGTFVFPCVPAGQYKVFAWHSVEGAEFEVSPTVGTAEVKEGRATLPAPFVLQGFTVTGRVLLPPNAKGASGAQILLDGQARTSTDAAGAFSLTRMVEGKYRLEVRLEGYEFPTYDLDMSPKSHALSPMSPSKIRVCGEVRLGTGPKGVVRPKTRKVTVSGGPDGPSSISTKEDGSFCAFLPPATYTFQAQLLGEERKAGMELVPEEKTVVLSGVPVSDVVFRQFQATVRGSLHCLSPCTGIGLRLLLAEDRSEVAATAIKETGKDHPFDFPNILPGEYYVVMDENTGLCWTNGVERKVSVTKTDKEGITFHQSGFQVSITASNSLDLHWAFSGSKEVKGREQIRKGPNSFCIPNPGDYSMRLDSCHTFDQGSELRYSTMAPRPVKLTATHHRVRGFLLSPTPVPDLALTLANPKTGSKSKLPVGKGVLKGKETVYEFSIDARVGETLDLVPSSATFLFSPKALPISVKDECKEGLEVKGYEGAFVNGKIEPAVAGVTIRLLQNSHVHKVVSDANGRYKVGPLENVEGMTYEAEKEGYVLRHVNNGVFSALKLSELAIQVVGKDGQPLEGVLISLSGGTDYRSNNLTDASGTITFLGLSPGEYFIRPVLKEYKFEPGTKMVSVAEGKRLEVMVGLEGERVGFSGYGRVEEVGGEAVAGAVVAALGGKECGGVEEEGRTGEDGAFRIRGLIPGCPFTLRLKAHPDVTDTIPPTISIHVPNLQDVHNLRFLAAPVWKTLECVEVSGKVVTERAEWLKSCRVILIADSDPDSPIATQQMNVATTFYFHNIPIDNRSYTVRLESSLSKSEFDTENLAMVSFLADSDLKFVTLELKPTVSSFFLVGGGVSLVELERRRVEAEVGRSGWVLVGAVLVGLVWLWRAEEAVRALGLVWEWVVGRVRAGRARAAVVVAPSPDSSPDLSSPSDIKKRPRSRKT